jgi:hypothetical protein
MLCSGTALVVTICTIYVQYLLPALLPSVPCCFPLVQYLPLPAVPDFAIIHSELGTIT